ncbi:hypothetical protein K458DRAFT_421151 [Lentithecium fluviatile CBS 122367]|uniref:Uncharacterized protein n=1 Tax=Lentithecium fluviatile CBS 122367 TaxID=1168545 RepID=A0A6G1IRE6_9PLEO|nr:hypothetical protein K458DRAFT_421151 [Lentithecium fluviatile CBS 122367]
MTILSTPETSHKGGAAALPAPSGDKASVRSAGGSTLSHLTPSPGSKNLGGKASSPESPEQRNIAASRASTFTPLAEEAHVKVETSPSNRRGSIGSVSSAEPDAQVDGTEREELHAQELMHAQGSFLAQFTTTVRNNKFVRDTVVILVLLTYVTAIVFLLNFTAMHA